MVGSEPLTQAQRALNTLTAAAPGDDALASLAAARRLREAAEEIEHAWARDARWAGATWTTIGALYGTSKQGAQQRFGKAMRKRSTPPDQR